MPLIASNLITSGLVENELIKEGLIVRASGDPDDFLFVYVDPSEEGYISPSGQFYSSQ
jgi:hypothetical protein